MRRKQKHLDFFDAEGTRLGWDRESDPSRVEAFMRGSEPQLSLTAPPPRWRLGLAWCFAVVGALTFLGAVQNCFPKKPPGTDPQA